MIIGVPKEIKEQEQRVALLPSAAEQLKRRGHTVLVEKNAGVGSGYPDEEYAKAGAEIVDSAAEVFERADLIVKVKEPLKAEFPLLRKGQILFTYLHLAASKPLTEALLSSGVTGVAYETIQVGNRLPLLEPMSEIAGRMSVVMGANFLAKYNGGSGVLLGGVPGVLPGRVVVVGGGTSGVNAARMATGLGADVTILDVDLERVREVERTRRLTLEVLEHPAVDGQRRRARRGRARAVARGEQRGRRDHLERRAGRVRTVERA
jgi:alanine dehydrogenase